MPGLERMNPQTPCPVGTEPIHHPHRMVCNDSEDECWDEWRPGKYEPYNVLLCCVDGEEWPCKTKQAHQREKAARHG